MKNKLGLAGLLVGKQKVIKRKMIKTNKKARIAIFQIVNLVLSIIAFGFIIGMVNVGVVK